jgi:hypothetical protein
VIGEEEAIVLDVRPWNVLVSKAMRVVVRVRRS